ncbi:MAG: OPT family oligopeptide transporter [Deltaproteobacteria bacterium]|nr:OPT family oligopeptide transporter [Myxococcales bacterium]MDP3213719.1 OPT family oligopeptide transporter [Deltaproteobacteria bacterium]
MSTEVAPTPVPSPEAAPSSASEAEIRWFRDVYQGDRVPQFTLRSFIMGSLLGSLMALSNLYVGLKTGWGLGVAITACILSFTVYSVLSTVAPKVFGSNMSILENNAMASTASSAGYSTGGTMVSAICALLLVQGHHLPFWTLTAWTFLLAILGTVMAIPMKRQMINIEQLKFPSGMAAAETLRSLYGTGGEAKAKARALFWTMGMGAVVAWLRDAHAASQTGVLAVLTRLSKIPSTLPIPFLTISGRPAMQYTIGFEGSLILVAAGAMMGLRTTATMLVASLINYGVIAPRIFELGGITRLGYRGIVTWSLWPGAAIMVTSGLLSFALQWRTVVRAFSGLGKAFSRAKAAKATAGDGPFREAALVEPDEDPMERIEVPPTWFVGGMAFATIGLVIVGYFAFGIAPWLSVLAVVLSFVLAIVACRATGETDTTPVGAMGKITQLTYGALAPSNLTTNLMTASITAGAAGSAADLLTDLKSGYLLGANPRKQFLAQLSGTVVGTLVVVPAFYKLVPNPAILGSDRFPAPSAQVWRGVAEVLARGVHSLHPTARWAMLVGALIGVALPLLELTFPKHKKYMPSAMGLGLALVIPAFNSVSMFIGAVLAALWMKRNERRAEAYTIPIASGIIAGESLMGVAVALLAASGYLQ